MSDMVERGVDAMLATELDVTMWARSTVMELVVAVIKSMRDPTSEMIDKGALHCGTHALIEAAWRDMIDEALKEH